MQVWQGNAATSQGKLSAAALARLRQGIILSLRQFSISAVASADDANYHERSRKARSETAVQEVSSFRVRRQLTLPRGVDARPLEARPAPGAPLAANVRRVDMGSFRGRSGGGFGRGTSRGGGFNDSYNGGTGRGGGFNNSYNRGNGDWGRGSGGPGEMTGGNRRGETNEDTKHDPSERVLTDEEWKILDATHMGRYTAYQPPTEEYETVEMHGIPVATSSAPQGLRESVLDSVRVATRGMSYETVVHVQEHMDRMTAGKITVVEPGDAKDRLELYHQSKVFNRLEEQRRTPREMPMFPKLSEDERQSVGGEIVAGRYADPGFVDVGDTMGQVRNCLLRNSTYLPTDMKKLEARLTTLFAA